jgi:hypothetical protein
VSASAGGIALLSLVRAAATSVGDGRLESSASRRAVTWMPVFCQMLGWLMGSRSRPVLQRPYFAVSLLDFSPAENQTSYMTRNLATPYFVSVENLGASAARTYSQHGHGILAKPGPCDCNRAGPGRVPFRIPQTSIWSVFSNGFRR